jgi:hypothetical protein
MTKSVRTVIVAVVAMAVVYILTADSASAQCVMCRASLAGNSSFVKNLNIGVAVLLAPPVGMFCAFFFIAFRNRK